MTNKTKSTKQIIEKSLAIILWLATIHFTLGCIDWIHDSSRYHESFWSFTLVVLSSVIILLIDLFRDDINVFRYCVRAVVYMAFYGGLMLYPNYAVIAYLAWQIVDLVLCWREKWIDANELFPIE